MTSKTTTEQLLALEEGMRRREMSRPRAAQSEYAWMYRQSLKASRAASPRPSGPSILSRLIAWVCGK